MKMKEGWILCSCFIFRLLYSLCWLSVTLPWLPGKHELLLWKWGAVDPFYFLERVHCPFLRSRKGQHLVLVPVCRPHASSTFYCILQICNAAVLTKSDKVLKSTYVVVPLQYVLPGPDFSMTTNTDTHRRTHIYTQTFMDETDTTLLQNVTRVFSQCVYNLYLSVSIITSVKLCHQYSLLHVVLSL